MPATPFFIVGPRGFITLELTLRSQVREKLLVAISGFYQRCTAYDSDGQCWRSKGVDGPYRRNWWTVLLANTIYNPWITVTLLWHEPRPYDLQEFKSQYIGAVQADDDILTQFVLAEDLRKRIEAARTFEELVAVYQWMQCGQENQHAA